jgi:hypothetical protein
MTSSSAELQKLVFATLKANAAIMDIAHDVYDRVPASPFGTRSAYISFGPEDAREDDAEGISGREVTLQIDIWSRAPGFVECKRLTDLVRRALHHTSLEMADNALADMFVELTRVFRDGDGVTSHGVVQVTALIEET